MNPDLSSVVTAAWDSFVKDARLCFFILTNNTQVEPMQNCEVAVVMLQASVYTLIQSFSGNICKGHWYNYF